MTDHLTGRDAQIGAQSAAGQNDQQIADELCRAPPAVRTHLATIYSKLEVSSKLELHGAMGDVREQAPIALPSARLPEMNTPIGHWG